MIDVLIATTGDGSNEVMTVLSALDAVGCRYWLEGRALTPSSGVRPARTATSTSASTRCTTPRRSPQRLLADAGYRSEDNLAALGEERPDCFIATRNQRRHPQPRNGRRGPLPAGAGLVDKMDRKVSTKAGRAAYQKRQHVIERIFGQTKDARTARRFMRRGKSAAQVRVETADGRLQPEALPPLPHRPRRTAAAATC